MVKFFEFEKVRDFSEIISDTFNFLKTDFRKILRFLLIYAGPIVLLHAIAAAYFQIHISRSFTPSLDVMRNPGDYYLSVFQSNMVFIVVFLFLSFLSVIFITSASYAYISTYRKNKGEEFEVEIIWEEMQRILPSIAGNTFLLLFLYFVFGIVAVIFFTLMLGVPIVSIFFMIIFLCFFVYFAISSSFLYCFQVFQNKGFGSALSSSFKLISNYWWYTFAVLIIMGIITAVFSYVAGIPSQIVNQIFKHQIIESSGFSAPSLLYMFFTSFSLFVGTLLSFISVVCIVLQYFSLIEKKESPQLIQQIDEL